MKKVFIFIFFVSLFIFLSGLSPSIVNAASCASLGGKCADTCDPTKYLTADDCPTTGLTICCKIETINVDIGQPSGVKITSLGSLISALISAVFIIAGLLCFVFLVWGGIQWITSGGDKAGVEAAQKKIQAAIIGLIIVFASWAIMKVLSDFLGINVFSLAFPKPY